MPATQNTTCPVCGGTLAATAITHEERRGDKLYLFQHVPARICERCGEVWIEETVLEEMDRLIACGRPHRVEATPVFDLALTPAR
jgi:YgiT-type zinc finger domain-containing protein